MKSLKRPGTGFQREDDAEGAIAVAHGLGQDPDGRQVVDLVEFPPTLVHLLPDRIEVLGPARDFGLDADLPELLLQKRDQGVDLGLALEPALGHPAHQLLVVLGLHHPQRQVLELGLDLGHAEPVRQRGVDVEGLLGDLLGPVGRQVVERAHVVQAVRELDHQHAEVVGHGHDHLPEVLRLPLLPRGEGELADLGHSVDEVGDFRPELPRQVVLGGPRILEHVVQEAGDDRGDVHLEVHEEAGDFQGVGEVGLARCALLALVALLGEAVGAVHQVQVGTRLVLRNLLNQRL